MEYRITKDQLKNDALYDTLQALCQCLHKVGSDLYIVGACARDLSLILLNLDASSRKTRDLDVAILLTDWSSFDRLCLVLQEHCFKRYKNTQKFFYKGEDGKNDYEVDVVPFGEIAEEEKIKWPPDGNPEMSVRCFTDVMAHADTIIIDEEVIAKMAPLGGQFLIKLDTWNDRHKNTDKDAKDMFALASKYFDFVLEVTPERFGEVLPDIVDEQSHSEHSGVFFLTSDGAAFLNREHLEFFIDLVKSELAKADQSDLIAHTMGNYSANDDNAYDKSFKFWKVVLAALEEQLSKMQYG